MNQETIMELFKKEEELDPELQRYLEKTGDFLSIRHPLVFSIMHSPQLNAMTNAQLRQKQELLAKAKAEKKWTSYVWLHERPYRFQAFIEIIHQLSNAQYWKLLGEIWIDTENLWQYKSILPVLITNPRPGKEHLMDEDERKVLHDLPTRITVYRGHQGKNRKGWSWTLSYWHAQWFSQRFNSKRHAVVRGEVDKHDVIALLTRRKEVEIIAEPGFVRNIKTVATPVRFNFVDKPSMGIHGIWHWDKVAMNAAALAKHIPDADATVCHLFAYIHDSKRLNDDSDPEHGLRAAMAVVEQYKVGGFTGLTSGQIDKLVYACEYHDKGQVTDDPTIGCCWDADRLDLVRCGEIPDPKFLSTPAAKDLLWRI